MLKQKMTKIMIKENKLPKLNQGDKVTATQIEPAQHFTQPLHDTQRHD